VFLMNSAKRQGMFHSNVCKIMPASPVFKLKKFCATRWVVSHSCIVTFLNMLHPVIATLEDISGGADREAASKANAHLQALCTCQFVTALVVLESFAALFLPLSKSLQSQDIDLLQARDDISGITDVLQLRRQEADERFQRHFQSVEALCQQHDINIQAPRRTGIQTHRSNYNISVAATP